MPCSMPSRRAISPLFQQGGVREGRGTCLNRVREGASVLTPPHHFSLYLFSPHALGVKGRGKRTRMTGEGEEESCEALTAHRLDRLGLQVKLDKGFQEGIYSIDVEFDELASRVGFTAARRTAGEYCARLKEQLGRSCAHALGEIEDASRTGDPRRKRDLELTFLSFAVETADARFHDRVMQEQFRVAVLRAGQAWEQSEASAQARRRHTRQERFRHQLAALLSGEVYAGVDATIKERLLDEIPPLAFSPRGIGAVARLFFSRAPFSWAAQ
jgi:hypothetical protein